MGSGAFLGYRVYRAAVAGGVAGEPVLLTRVLGLTYADATVEWNTTYRYTVIAMTEFGEGPARAAGPVTPVQDAVPSDDGSEPPAPVERAEPYIAEPSIVWFVIVVVVAIDIIGVEIALLRMKRLR